MATTKYCAGKYIRIIDIAHKKRYVPLLITIIGGNIRYSFTNMKTATLALAWAKEWAERVNKRAEQKFAILTPTKDRNGRKNIIFEELG